MGATVVTIHLHGKPVKVRVMVNLELKREWGPQQSISSLMDEKEFMKYATDMDLSDLVKKAKPIQFETGSVGWHAHDLFEFKVHKETVRCNGNVNVTLWKSQTKN